MAGYELIHAKPQPVPPPIERVILDLSVDEFKTLACLQWCHLGMQHRTRIPIEETFNAIRNDLGYTPDDIGDERRGRIG